jgi:hypothetical protein
MLNVNDIFSQGPNAVCDWLAALQPGRAIDDMDVKELADICWTRASTLAKVRAGEARKWGQAALAGYEYLGRFGRAAAAESAHENAAALRSWRLLREVSPINEATN